MQTMRLASTTRVLVAFIALMGLAGCGASQVTATQTMTVTLTDGGITATPSTAHAGMRYHFVVTNTGTVSHEFMIMPPGIAEYVGQMPMAQWMRQARYTTGPMAPGMNDEFDFTFANLPMMQQGQRDVFGCYADGSPVMYATIDLQP
jgi:uncharacterized cupredoxin-like copper-binding protein